MRKWCSLALTILILFASVPALPGEAKLERKRQAIDSMASAALDRLFRESPESRALYRQAAGFAVFDSLKVALLISGGGGVGVAVDRGSGEQTYMKMGTAGIGLGLGGQSYEIVLLFESAATFDRFVRKGWQADVSASAAAGTTGTNAATSFTNGLAVYQMTHKGLIATADISGTKFWKAKKLNRPAP